MASQARHGTRTRYVRGCRCDECKEANREYSTTVRNRRNGLDDVSSIDRRLTSVRGESRKQGRPRLVPEGPAQPDDSYGDESVWTPGLVETGVLMELKTLSAAKKQPGIVAGIIQMARIQDSPKLATAHPVAFRQMSQGLNQLRSASAGRSGKLASVAALTRREKPVESAVG